ncbi:MAG: hypothetical protein JWM53_830 [bacterium]|nr:hypothetical protein [bacterium]
MADATDPFSEFRLRSSAIALPIRDRESLATQLPANDTAGTELALLPAPLFPISDDADLARKHLAAHIWQTRLSTGEQLALRALIDTTPPADVAATLVWRNVFWLVFVPPSGVVHLYGERAFKWRLYGGGVPLYQEGWSDPRSCATLYVGWGLSFASVDVLVAPDDHVRTAFEGFPARS